MKKIILISLCIISLIVVVGGLTRCDGKQHDKITTDTIYVTDTLYYPKLDSVEVIKYYPMMIYDTITDMLENDTTIIQVDTFYCDIPISRYTFDTTLAQTQISGVINGFQVEMEQLTAINMKTSTTTIKKPRTKRWGVGINVGYGVGVSGDKITATPYVGLGISYNILTF